MKKNISLIIICLTYLISFQLLHAISPKKVDNPSKIRPSPIENEKWEAAVKKIFEDKGACLRPSTLYFKLKKVLETDKSQLINLTNMLSHKDTGNPVLPPKHSIGLEEDIESFQVFMNQATGHKYLVFAPVNDITSTDHASKIKSTLAGNYPINTALKDFQKFVNEIDLRKYTALIPMTLFRRKHWILLQITKSSVSSKHVKITLIDSKGRQASAFSTTHIQTVLEKYFPESDIRHLYLGHQGLFNDKDCGFYAIAYTLYLLYGFPTKDLKMVDFSELI
ncbi:MAG: hypothetical protein CMM87_03505 [Rickettsiales bacterium]|nr:hypothetical protein [Rickettsiales bacterium]|tara:strand:+ start:9470 stop:10306 length:837 start_codon:yes stop_codon:yes gene_type:complete